MDDGGCADGAPTAADRHPAPGVAAADADTVAVRHGAGPGGDGPSLADTVRVLQGTQRLLAATAELLDERDGDGAGTGRRPGRARAFLRTVRLGPVGERARELVVHVPVEPATADGLFPRTEDPFARQVTVALARAVRAAHEAAELGAADGAGGAEAFRLSAGLGVTAGLCRTLAAMAGERPAPVELAFTWSPGRPRPPDEPVCFAVELLEPLRRGGAELDRPEVIAEVVLRGRVTDLRLEPEQAQGTIGVRGHFASDPLRRSHQADVRVSLPAYHRALRAHSDARPVEVRGSLELRRSRWLLVAEGLSLVDDP